MTRPPPTFSTNQPDSFTNLYTINSNEHPSANPSGPPSDSSLGTQAGQANSVVIIVSVIIIFLVASLIITISVVLMAYRKANWFSHNQTAANHLSPMHMPLNQVVYTQNSNHHDTCARTSPTVHTCSQAVVDWTSKADNTSEQMLMDSAPPAYHVALKFLQSPSKSEDPPPYPGWHYDYILLKQIKLSWNKNF